jgi:hypothetical protein
MPSTRYAEKPGFCLLSVAFHSIRCLLFSFSFFFFCVCFSFSSFSFVCVLSCFYWYLPFYFEICVFLYIISWFSLARIRTKQKCTLESGKSTSNTRICAWCCQANGWTTRLWTRTWKFSMRKTRFARLFWIYLFFLFFSFLSFFFPFFHFFFRSHCQKPENSGYPKCYFKLTFFYPTLTQYGRGYNYAKVQKWTKNVWVGLWFCGFLSNILGRHLCIRLCSYSIPRQWESLVPG